MPPTPTNNPAKFRIALYSHDTFGLGHLGRCRTIAHALVDNIDDIEVLILTGSPKPEFFSFKDTIKIKTLTAITKTGDGKYKPANKNLSLKQALKHRTEMISETLDDFAPQMFIVDKEPIGLLGELEPVLQNLKSNKTRLVLGLRDVLDSAELVAEQWDANDLIEITTELYDEIWIYGPRSFNDPLQGLPVPELLKSRMIYTGFLTPKQDSTTQNGDYLLVTAGGSGDGASLFNAVLNAYEKDQTIPAKVVLLPGPFLPDAQRHKIIHRADKLQNVSIAPANPNVKSLLAGAKAIVSMCGYNSFCENLAAGKPVLYVPRVSPRAEQMVRASRASELGLATLLEPGKAKNSKTMAAALRQLLARDEASRPDISDMINGQSKIIDQVRTAIAGSTQKENTLAIILKGYPRLSETFIAQEILGLERAGFRLQLYSLRRPTDEHTHPVHDEISAFVRYLPEYLHDEPLRLLRCWWLARAMPGYKAARKQFRADFARDNSRNRIRRFGQALVLATELRDDIAHLHAHFLHTPATVTFYTSLLTGIDYTCSAHAKDIWTSDDEDLQTKLDSANWVVTCTKNGWKYLKTLAGDPSRVHLSYHGLDLARFGPSPTKPSKRDGSDPDDPVVLVTVSRAVEKKGLDTTMLALAHLPSDLNWKWIHIGGGELTDILTELADELGIADRIEWRGALPQTKVLAQYRTSDIFILACRVAQNGDMDGLPNVIVEAQSQRLPVISTTVSGVPELIEHDKNGLLVEPDEPLDLARAMLELITNPRQRIAMGKKGEKRVRKKFDHTSSVTFLTNLFEKAGVNRRKDIS